MARQFSTALRNAVADAYETAIGTAAIFRIFTGAPPANCSAASTGTLLAEMTLPSDWLTAASGGAKSLSGTWEDPTANATGTAGYFRVFDSTGSTCHDQGTITATGGGGDMTMASTSLTSGAPVRVTQFDVTMGGA